MMIPLLLLVLTAVAIILVFALKSKNRTLFTVLAFFLWLLSLVSAFFAGWAWLERGYSENWAMYGFFFISLPIIVLVSIVSLCAVIEVKIRKIENMKNILLSLYILLAFLALQTAAGVMAG